jgi:hypothetical protein
LFPENRATKPLPGSLNDDSLVRGVITRAIKQSGKSREQIADEMSVLLAMTVTARMIAAFLAESKELHRWPGAWDRALCVATGDDTLLRCRVELAGFKVMSSADVEVMELGRQYLLRQRATEHIAQLERRLAGVEL